MKSENMKKLIASCLILSLLGSTASVCFASSDVPQQSVFAPGNEEEEEKKEEKSKSGTGSSSGSTSSSEENGNGNQSMNETQQIVEEKKENETQQLVEEKKEEQPQIDTQTGVQQSIKTDESTQPAPPQTQQTQQIEVEKNETINEELVSSTSSSSSRSSSSEEEDPGLSTGAKVGIGVVVAAGVAAVVTAVVVPCVIFKDKIKDWFTGPFVDFFTKTIPNAFTPKKKASK